MLTSIVAALGSGMKGYAEGRRQNREDEFRQEQQDRQRKAWKADDDLQAGLAEAAKPATVENGEVYQPQVDDEGNKMPDNPTAGTFKAGGQRFTSMADAQAAADKANTPDAQAARMADVYAKAGKPAEAMQLRASAKQAKLADYQLSKEETQFLDDRFNREMDNLFSENGGAIKGAAAYLTRTQLGGAAGKNFVVRDTPDGKQTQIWMIDQNGNEQVYKSYPSGERGEAMARNEMLRADPKAKTLFLFDLSRTAEAERQSREKMVLDERRVTADEIRADAAAKNADTQARRMDAVLSGVGRQAAGQGAAQPGGVAMDGVDKVLAPLYSSKDEMTGVSKVDTKALEFVRQFATRMPAAQVGDAAGAALQAHNIYQAELAASGGDHKKAMSSIQQRLAAPTQPQGPAAASANPAPTTPAQKPAMTPMQMSRAVNPDASDEAYVREKLMGRFDGTDKLAEIAASNPNPRFRAAAQRMLDASKRQGEMPSMTGLGL